MTIASLRRLAVLSESIEAETTFGGRSRTWSEVASLWVDLSLDASRETVLADQAAGRPVLISKATAEARDNPLAARGQRLTLDGQDWRVTAVEHDRPVAGRMTLTLDRETP